MLPTGTLPPLIVFTALIFAAALHGLAASGHFPRQHRATALASGLGPTILFGSIAIVIVCLVAGIGAALRLIPWYAAIISGGLAVLSAPLVLQRLPNDFVDGRNALIVFSTSAGALALLSVWISTG